MRILYIAYPLLPVSEESCGGAEQVLWTLEAEMARRGHETVVAACAGSRVSGELFSTGAAVKQPDSFQARDAEHTARVLEHLGARSPSSVMRDEVGARSPSSATHEEVGARSPSTITRGEVGARSPSSATPPFDLVHDHSGSFWQHAADIDAPVLATLHLPRSFYPANAFDSAPQNLHCACVSESQRKTFLPIQSTVVRNGIRVHRFPTPDDRPREPYLLWLGRICEEKGAHIAIDVARRAGKKLIIAGDVYPFSYHQQYFTREIEPNLGEQVTFVRKPSFASKIELLRRASALLLPSLVDETSSLVAMEAMACGTPVIAFARGAVPEVVRGGVTGFVVSRTEEMVAAVTRVAEIQPMSCRTHVEQNFSATRMADDYEHLYAQIVRSKSCQTPAA